MKKMKNTLLKCITIVALAGIVAGFFTKTMWPNRTIVLELVCFEWLMMFGFANGLFTEDK